MRTWHIVHMQSKVLSPAAEAFRYFMIEHGEPYLRAELNGLQRELAPPASDQAAGSTSGRR